ncbi:MAG: S9 family peptidase [Betaproteobacteria bacterium]
MNIAHRLNDLPCPGTTRSAALLPIALLVTALAGCAAPAAMAPGTAAPTTADKAAPAVVTAPPALTMRGVPPVPVSLMQRIGRYTEIRGAGLADWSPDGKQLLVSWLAGPAGQQRTQLHQVSAAGAPLQQVTRANEPTRSGRYLPADPNVIVFERDAGGSEATQVFRLDLRSGAETALTTPGQRCDSGPFSRDGRAMLVNCARIDRSAADRNAGISNDLHLIDVMTGTRRASVSLPGTGWWAADMALDGRTALVNLYRSASEVEVWRVDLTSGERRKLLPRDGEPAQYTLASSFTADDRRFFVISDRFGEFRQAFRYDPQTHAFEGLTADIPWDARGGDLSDDRSRVLMITNEAGVGVPRLYDTATLKPLPLKVPAGLSVTRARLSKDGTRVAYAGTSSAQPSAVRVIDMASGGDRVWVAADTAGLDTRAFTPIETIRWRSFDGREISGLIQRPPTRFSGKRPVLIEIHGGPEAQATLSFNGRYNYIVNELGIAFIEPNVRGSTGFGKTFHQLDNGKLREDSVKDIGALLDWIAQQPDLDASRVVVQGGSYGGYMANAVAVHYSNRIRGAIPAVGISNFVSFLERTESYRRDLRRSEYGDERHPEMRKFLTKISPLTNASQIKVPMFIVHGRNDPRVQVQEAEQIAATVAANGVPVWSMIAENEGHGFAKKENADYLFAARVMVLAQRLLSR